MYFPTTINCPILLVIIRVLWSGTRVTYEVVLDGGGRLIPAYIVGLHTLPLLLASLVAHDRATGDNHTTRRDPGTNTNEHDRTRTLPAGTVHSPRQGSINSVPL